MRDTDEGLCESRNVTGKVNNIAIVQLVDEEDYVIFSPNHSGTGRLSMALLEERSWRERSLKAGQFLWILLGVLLFLLGFVAIGPTKGIVFELLGVGIVVIGVSIYAQWTRVDFWGCIVVGSLGFLLAIGRYLNYNSLDILTVEYIAISVVLFYRSYKLTR